MSAGEFIWQGLKPCLKMLFTIGCGFTLTKKGLFPPAASKGLSQVTMNIGLPSLLFSSMVPSFNSTNISNFGPLCMVAILYQFIGLVLILIIREVFYVPKDFQWGIILLGMISNWGNLPTAIVQSVATEQPFDSQTDPELGIAYIAVFILIMNSTFYGTGLYRICGWDLRDDVAEVPRTFAGRMDRRKKQYHRFMAWLSRKRHGRTQKNEKVASETAENSPEMDTEEKVARTLQRVASPPFPRSERMVSTHADIESLAPYEDTGAQDQHATSLAKYRSRRIAEENQVVPGHHQGDDKTERERTQVAHDHPKTTILKSVLHSLRGMLTPATLGVIVSLPFALVPPLKALVVQVDGWSGTRVKNAPDGTAPLAFFYDFTVFVGAMTIPGALIVLGASFARLKLSRERFGQMPLGAIFASTASKMIITPVIGIFMVIDFRDSTHLFPRDEKMLSFVAYLLSGTPSAVNQLVVTQIFLKEGQTTDTLASFLIVQYAILLVQSAILTAISLWLVS